MSPLPPPPPSTLKWLYFRHECHVPNHVKCEAISEKIVFLDYKGRFACVWTSHCITTKSMHDWIVKGQIVASYHPACVLNGLPDFEDIHTFADKTVLRFCSGVRVRKIDISGFYSFPCAIRATKNMTNQQMCELLQDKSLLNTTNAPSLTYAKEKVFVCLLNHMWTGGETNALKNSVFLCHVLNSHSLSRYRTNNFR